MLQRLNADGTYTPAMHMEDPMSTVPTVRVQNPDGDGVLTLNRSDYDPAVHGAEFPPELTHQAEGSPGDSKATNPPEDLSKLKKTELIAALEAAGGNLAEVQGTGKNSTLTNRDLVSAIEAARAKQAEGSQGE